MGDAPASTSKKQAKKKASTKKPADHPKYNDMIRAAIHSLKERSGSSRQAIYKYVKGNYKVGDNCKTHLKLALKRGVNAGNISQITGTGASGSFKIPQEKKESKKVVAKKLAARKPTAKKSTITKKKVAARKSTAKKTKKSPTKKAFAKKPAAKKAAAKKPVAKKPAAKKARRRTKKPAKKSAKK